MKKLLMILCVVLFFFAIVGCPQSNDQAAPAPVNKVVTSTGGGDDGGGDGGGPGPAPVPEPATLILLGSGLVGLAAVGRKKFFKKD